MYLTLKKRNQMPLFEALEKIKEELMLLGFISLLLTVFRTRISMICIPERYTHTFLPCKWPGVSDSAEKYLGKSIERRVLVAKAVNKCKEGTRPFISPEGMHELHIFIFVLAVVHVLSSALIMVLGSIKIQTWKSWEEEIRKSESEKDGDDGKVTHVAHDRFVKKHSVGAKWVVLSWVISFFKQFYGSVSKTDYSTLRLGFIETHCKTNPKFDFYKYMMRTLEADFKKVVGISNLLWFFLVIFLLLNIDGWNAYFWISFIPLLLLLVVGAKLEHVISQLAQDVLEKHTAFEGQLVVRPSDEHFWFGRPKLVLKIVHFILFQNAFEVSYFVWILTTFGMKSCIMGNIRLVIARLIICALAQLLCSYSTLPLYALVTQMGSSFKSAIFEEHIQQGISVWRRKAKMNAKKPIPQSAGNYVDEGSVEMSSLDTYSDTKVLIPNLEDP